MKELTVREIENEDYVQTEVADLKYRLQIARTAMDKWMELDLDVEDDLLEAEQVIRGADVRIRESHREYCFGPVVRDGQYACTCGLEG
jgi:hypothetical protein